MHDEERARGAMIPAEDIETYQRRLRWEMWTVVGWMSIQTLFFPVLTIWMMLARNGKAPMPGRGVLLSAFLLVYVGHFLIHIPLNIWLSRKAIRCPVCGTKLKGRWPFKQLVETGRCARCETLIAIPKVRDVSGEDSSTRREFRRILLLIAVVGVSGPLLVFWLAAWQLIPANAVWALILAMVPAFLELLMKFSLPLLLLNGRKKRRHEDALLAEIVPPYPMLTVLRASGIKGSRESRAFHMFFVPTGLRFGRLCNKLHFFNPMARRFEAAFGARQTREQKDKRRRELLYRSIDPTGPEFFELDPENFEIPREEIRELVYEPVHKWSFFAKRSGAVGSGYLHIEKNDGRRKKFIMADELSQAEVDAMLSEWTNGEVSNPALAEA